MTPQLPSPRESAPLRLTSKRNVPILCAGGFLVSGHHLGLVTDPRDRLSGLLLSAPAASACPERN
jgi:hypothetical protein